jgi:hypothetical protein
MPAILRIRSFLKNSFTSQPENSSDIIDFISIIQQEPQPDITKGNIAKIKDAI